MTITVDEAFSRIKRFCHPSRGIGRDRDEIIFNLFFSYHSNSNFIGGCNDDRNTLHENIFSLMYPNFESQVVFGTGKGGYEKYLSKKYSADFYNRDEKTIYEIDGKSHKEDIRAIKDRIRDYFFWHEKGIRTVRITNEEVESMLLERLQKISHEGKLDELFER